MWHNLINISSESALSVTVELWGGSVSWLSHRTLSPGEQVPRFAHQTSPMCLINVYSWWSWNLGWSSELMSVQANFHFRGKTLRNRHFGSLIFPTSVKIFVMKPLSEILFLQFLITESHFKGKTNGMC